MYQYHTLRNGIRIIFRQNTSHVVYTGIYINAGSRDEHSKAEEGIAHFIEHSLFKGTKRRHSHHIRNRIDGVGGELDAFTTKEETCIYATALSQHWERCPELLSDILFHSTFPPNEIEKEKDVVIEEINLYKDSPAELIYDDFEEMIFGDHPLAHNILGSKKNVRHFSSPQLAEFLHRNYTPDRIVISIVGNLDFKKVVRLCEKHFEETIDSPAGISAGHQQNAPAVAYRHFNTTVHKRTHQVHLLMGCPAPHIFDNRKNAFSLLNNILGGPAMNSRLNVSVRENQGFCYTIESQYVPFSDAGLFYIYAGVDNGAAERSTQLIFSELRKLRERRLTPRQLHAAQQQLIGQIAITNDSGLNEMQSIGKAYLNFDHVDTLEEINRDILAVTPEEIQEVAQEILAEEHFSLLYYK